ncbi:MAG: hypothetical protein AB2827_06545 [Candidatus Thiodiazotropha sp.]
MGLVKQIWMEEQELQPMYEWIEDNYGEDLDQDNDEEWEEAVGDYNAYVEELQEQEALEHATEEYDYYIYLTLKDADKIFSEDLSGLEVSNQDRHHLKEENRLPASICFCWNKIKCSSSDLI